MKKIAILLLGSLILLVAACNNDKTKDNIKKSDAESSELKPYVPPSIESTAGNGSYTMDGKTYTGGVTTETNEGLSNLYTVTCNGDMIQMIEMHFKNEKVARKGGSFKPGSLVPGAGEDNEVGIMFGVGYKSREASEGTITITGSGGKNVIELNNVKLTIPDKSIIVSGKIPF